MAGFGGCPASCLTNRLLAGPHSPAPQWEDGGCPLPPPCTPRYLPSPRAASRRGAEPATLQPPGGSEPKAGAGLAGDRSAVSASPQPALCASAVTALGGTPLPYPGRPGRRWPSSRWLAPGARAAFAGPGSSSGPGWLQSPALPEAPWRCSRASQATGAGKTLAFPPPPEPGHRLSEVDSTSRVCTTPQNAVPRIPGACPALHPCNGERPVQPHAAPHGATGTCKGDSKVIHRMPHWARTARTHRPVAPSPEPAPELFSHLGLALPTPGPLEKFSPALGSFSGGATGIGQGAWSWAWEWVGGWISGWVGRHGNAPGPVGC